ncbi:hypothetical protein HK097_004858, partial [Rhizophlyctis rosea]
KHKSGEKREEEKKKGKDGRRRSSFGGDEENGKEKGGKEVKSPARAKSTNEEEERPKYRVGQTVAAFVSVPDESDDEDEVDRDGMEEKLKEACYIVIVDGYDSKTKVVWTSSQF